MSSNRRKPTAPGLPLDAQNKIGQRLKAIYDDVLQQPVPDRFVQLLKELDGKQPTRGADDTER